MRRTITTLAPTLAPRSPGHDDATRSEGGSDLAQRAEELATNDWLQAGIILAAAVVSALIAATVVGRLVARRNEMLASLAGRTVAAVVLVFGFIYALDAIGVAVGPLVGGLGLGGLALAFALRSIVNNLLAGVLVQLRQPFQVGDLVKLGDYFGRVEKVTLRTVDMQTVDGEYVLIPAATVLENPIENWNTLGRRREEVMVGIDYDVDIDRVTDGLTAAVSALDLVVATDDKPVKVVVDELAGSSVNLKVLAWHDVDDHFLDVTHAVAKACKEWCDDNDVNLPFPTRALKVDDAGELARTSPQNDQAAAESMSAGASQ